VTTERRDAEIPGGRIVDPAAGGGENTVDLSLRPKRFGEFIGQAAIVANLRTYIEAAIGRGEPLDHVLLSGPPGLGKTTLAHIIANEMGAGIRTTSGPAIERKGDIAAILTALEAGDLLFIDEIHRLPKIVEEILYSSMEDFVIDIVIGKDSGAKSIRVDLPPESLPTTMSMTKSSIEE